MVVEGQRTNFLEAKEVPDFERLYKKFVSTLERKKGTRFTTVPEPFSFDERDRYSRLGAMYNVCKILDPIPCTLTHTGNH